MFSAFQAREFSQETVVKNRNCFLLELSAMRGYREFMAQIFVRIQEAIDAGKFYCVAGGLGIRVQCLGHFDDEVVETRCRDRWKDDLYLLGYKVEVIDNREPEVVRIHWSKATF